MEFQEKMFLNICSIKGNVTNIIRKQDSDNIKYIFKRLNKLKFDRDIRKYLYDTYSCIVGEKIK